MLSAHHIVSCLAERARAINVVLGTQGSAAGLEEFTSAGEIKYATALDAFNEAAGNVVGDIKLAKAIINYFNEIKTRNDDHIQFFGGNLLGTQRIKFLDSDRNRWFDEVLLVDEEYLRECAHAVPTIRADWNVTGDVFNLSCVWVAHKLLSSPKASDKLIQEAAVITFVILQFRFLTSIYSNYFKRLVDEEAAQATYDSLTLKFALKQLGSWEAMLRDRAEDFVSKDGLHYKRLKDFAPDAGILYVVSDLQTRTRSRIKDMYAVLDTVRSNNMRVRYTSAQVEVDGDKIIRDQVNAFNSARYYLFDVAGNEASFIKRDLVNVILDLMTTVSEQAFVDLLRIIATTPTGKRREEIEWMMETTLMHGFDFICRNQVRFNDAANILVRLKAIYMSSKSSDPVLLEMRTRIEKFVKKHSHLRSSAALAAARTSLMLYFMLRALASNQYR